MLQVNDKVKFHTPNEDEDANQVYIILENNGDRCLIEAINTGLYIAPTYVVNTNDLILA